MKVFVVSEADFARLLLSVDRDPKHGHSGGSSQVLSEREQKAHDEAHAFYNYGVRKWIEEVRA